jgi:type VI secretion system secreted protein VgrG
VLSLFANTMGIRMLAAKGPVEIQAQSDVNRPGNRGGWLV